jgi:carbon-monoxide dehydrogenase medium subunit
MFMTSSPALFHPRNLSEALDLLATTADARPLSGGASLVAMMNAGLVAPAALVSLTRIPELCGIRVSAAGDIAIGAATRHNEIAGDGRLSGTAAVLADAAAPSEIVAAVHIHKPKHGVGIYLKHARVAGDFAIVSVAVTLARDGEVHVAIGGCGPSPLASAEADRILSSDLSRSASTRAGDLLAALANPVDDVRGTAKYRKVLIPRMLARALHDAVAASRSAA